MFQNLTPARQATLYIVSALLLTIPVAVLTRVLDLGELGAVIYMFGPTLAAFFLLFAVTDEGRKPGWWRRLGLRPLGLSYWPVAVIPAAIISVAAATAATGLHSAEYVTPDNWPTLPFKTATGIAIGAVSFTLGEELGWRGYLLPRLRPYGDAVAMLTVGVVHATWHMPLLLGTDVQKIEGSYLIFIPLFYASVIAGSFFIGLLRIYSNSVWPVVLAHGTHNAMWTTTGAFIVASSPAADDKLQFVEHPLR